MTTSNPQPQMFDRRTGDALVRVIETRLSSLQSDFVETKDVLKQLATAVNKLAIVEERQAQGQQAQERIFKSLEKIESRLDSLEKVAPLNDQKNKWVDGMVWAAAGAAILFIAKKVGLA